MESLFQLFSDAIAGELDIYVITFALVTVMVVLLLMK